MDVVHRGAEPSAHHDVQRPQAEIMERVEKNLDGFLQRLLNLSKSFHGMNTVV